MFNKKLKVDIEILKNTVSDLYNRVDVLIDKVEKNINNVKCSTFLPLEKNCKYLGYYNFDKNTIIVIFIIDITESGFYYICFQADENNKQYYKWMTKETFLKTCTILEKLKI